MGEKFHNNYLMGLIFSTSWRVARKENQNANKVRKSVPKQWDPQGSSKELSFGE